MPKLNCQENGGHPTCDRCAVADYEHCRYTKPLTAMERIASLEARVKQLEEIFEHHDQGYVMGDRAPLSARLLIELKKAPKSFNYQKVWDALNNSEQAYATQADLIENLEEKLALERMSHRKELKRCDEKISELLRKINDE